MDMLIKKDALLEILRQNRVDHRAVFEEAIVGYRVAVIAALDGALEEARSGKRIRRYQALPEPMDQTKEYDRAIRMLELDTREEIELEEHEVAQYVMDDWQWKAQFSASNRGYVSQHTAETYLAQ